jgi:putative endonuclease
MNRECCPVIPTVLWGRVRVPSGPREALIIGAFYMETFFVYIIQSEVDGSFYKGFTENPILRLQRHNNKETQSTCHLCPWKLVYVETLPSKTRALIREKNLKKATRERLQALINNSKNEVRHFIK